MIKKYVGFDLVAWYKTVKFTDLNINALAEFDFWNSFMSAIITRFGQIY